MGGQGLTECRCERNREEERRRLSLEGHADEAANDLIE